MEIFGQISVEITGDFVVIGPSKPSEVEIVAPSVPTSSYAGIIKHPTYAQIKLAIDALEYGVVTLPIRLDDLTPDQIEHVEKSISDCFNVALTKDNNSIILL